MQILSILWSLFCVIIGSISVAITFTILNVFIRVMWNVDCTDIAAALINWVNATK